MTDIINIAIVGCGRISDLHAAAYLNHPHAQISAICEPNADARAQRGDAWRIPIERRFENVDDMLAADGIDVVEVLVPHHLHEEVALKVIASGRHLSLQKPMAMDVDQADRIIQAARDGGVVLKVFENFVFYPPVVLAKDLVDAGEIGDVLSVRLKSHSGYSPNMWEIPKQTSAWRLDPSTCGGGPLVFDDGHHKFAIAWHLAGRAQRVMSDIGSWEGTAIDSPSNVMWRHENGAIGSLEVVFAHDTLINTKYYAQDDQVEITGTKGVIWVRGGHGRLTDAPPVSLYAGGIVRDFVDVERDWGVSFIRSGQHFIDALLSGQAPYLTGEQGRDVLAFTLAAQESGSTGCAVDPNYLT